MSPFITFGLVPLSVKLNTVYLTGGPYARATFLSLPHVCTGVTGTCVAVIGFLCGHWDSNSGPHDLLQVLLPTEPFPHPQDAYFVC